MFFKNRFTLRAESVLKYAHECAATLGHGYVGSEHILIALSHRANERIASAFEAVGVTHQKILGVIYAEIGKGAKSYATPQGLTPCARRIVFEAQKIAESQGKNVISEENLFLGILRDRDSSAMKVLESLGADEKKLCELLLSMGGESDDDFRRGDGARAIKERGELRMLKSFGRDMCALAREGRLDPVIGREKELDRMIRILARRTKNNPLLLGDAGVGKTALAEGLAQRIINGKVPAPLCDKKIYSVDISSVVAGTKYRGEFEERIKSMFAEVARAGDIIIFIDELHTIVGAGAAEGAIDAANILKPALSRREIQIIGATTFEEYRKYIERDAALQRRFQTVTVEEPGDEESFRIIKGLSPKYCGYHNCNISDGAIRAAIELSQRYINDRYLPDKAIDLIDEALSKKRIEMQTVPLSMQRLEENISDIIIQKKRSISEENFEKAANLKSCEKRLVDELSDMKKNWQRVMEGKNEIDEYDIARVISEQTKIPVSRISEGESARFLRLSEELSKKVVGQTSAVEAVAGAVRRARCGISDEARPIGSFLFAGPTGVGKTKLCLAIAECLFDGVDRVIRLDMSEYMEKHASAKLIGAPPGYVGYDDGKTLVEKVRKKPYSVILFDEIEKAHPDVFNLLLQILEDGMLTDAQGRRADFRNTVIVMTSNIGAEKMSSLPVGFLESSYESEAGRIRKEVEGEIRKTLRPELIGRIDEIIVFSKLGESELRAILDMMIESLVRRVEKKGISLSVDDSAKKYLIKKGCDPRFGARPLRSTLRREVEDKLAVRCLESTGESEFRIFSDGEQIKIEEVTRTGRTNPETM